MKLNNDLSLGSLFDGSAGFPLAGTMAGITPRWASEIEPFPIRVTTKRLPQMKHLGDISTINGAEIEPVDIITFGSPCQDMSIAGKRAGLDGSRSNLFYEAIRIVKEMRCATNGEKPRYIVWENVPGAFSSNGGEDFRAVLETVCSVKENVSVPRPATGANGKWTNAGEIVGNGYSVAWRVLDAQFWGVPQRRRRIFLIADFAGECAGEILFERQSLSGNTSQGESKGQSPAGTSADSTGASGGIVLNDEGGSCINISEDISGTLRAQDHGHPLCVIENSAGFCTEHSAKARSVGFEEERSPTLRAGTVPATVYENHSQDTRYTELDETAPTVSSTFGTGGNNQPFVVEAAKTYDVRFTSENTKVVRHNVYETDTCRTLDTSGNPPERNQGGVAVVEKPKALKIRSGCEGGGKGALIQEDKSATLGCNNDQVIFVPTSSAVCVDQGGGKSACNVYKEGSPTLTCTHGGEPVVALQGSMIGRKDENGPQGSGVDENVSFTLNATDKHAVAVCLPLLRGVHAALGANTLQPRVAYGIDRAAFNQGQNALYNFAVEEEVQPTMVAKGAGAVAQPANFYAQMKAESNCFRTDGISNTLVNGTNPGFQNAVVEPTYSANKASFFTKTEENIAGALVATDYKDPPLVNDTAGVEYIVRRLTPTECARLQGFPDWWCSDLGTDKPTEEDIAFWTEVFETYRKIMGTSSKPKSRSQIIKWLKDPHSDSAEYKMWGNGVALPCVFFVLSRIAKAYSDEMHKINKLENT